MAKKQWDLTDAEIAEVIVRQENRVGRVKLLEAFQRQLGIETKAEISWWEALTLRLKIPSEYRYRLIVDHKCGKVWVKGEVKELDNTQQGQFDNPYD